MINYDKKLWELKPGTQFVPEGHDDIVLTKLNGGIQKGQLPIKKCGKSAIPDEILCMNFKWVVDFLDSNTKVKVVVEVN